MCNCVSDSIMHVLVSFEEEGSSAVVPISKVSLSSIECVRGSVCEVILADGKTYNFIVLATGT